MASALLCLLPELKTIGVKTVPKAMRGGHMRATRGTRTSILFLTGILACLLVTSVTVASENHISLVVQVTEPFEVNGKLYPAGTLHVKSVRDYNPSQSINELWREGECLGYLLARKGEAGSYPVRHDTMLFTRNNQGHLILAGYVLVGQGSNELFRYQDVNGKGRWTNPRPTEEPVFIAASLR
jgi:hypothetical protein